MLHADTIGLLKGYVSAQQYGSAGDKRARPQPFVTISREAGSGSRAIGQKLVELLRREDKAATSTWLWFDRDLIDHVIKEHGLSETVVRSMLGGRYSRLLECIDELLGKYPTWSTVTRKTSETILNLAQFGNVILVGRGAHMVTRRLPHGLRVRLIGSLPRRLQHLQDFHGMTREAALKYMEFEDLSRATHVRDQFGVDIADCTRYAIVLNTDHIDYGDAARIIADQVLRLRERIENEVTDELHAEPRVGR